MYSNTNTVANKFYCVFQSDEDIREAITVYNQLCGYEAQCAVATNAITAVSTCSDALQNGDIGDLCTATCRSLTNNLINSCPSVSGSYM